MLLAGIVTRFIGGLIELFGVGVCVFVMGIARRHRAWCARLLVILREIRIRARLDSPE